MGDKESLKEKDGVEEDCEKPLRESDEFKENGLLKGSDSAEHPTQPAEAAQLGKQLTHMAVRKWLGVFLCTFEIMFFSGIHYGYSNLVAILTAEGIFACPAWNETATGNLTSALPVSVANNSINANLTAASACETQQSSFSNVFGIAGSVQTLSPLFIGVMFDLFGTRLVKISGGLMFLLGVLLIAFLDPETSGLLYLALPLIGVSSVCVMLTGFQVAELFSGGRFIVLTLLTGAYDSATIVFWLVRKAWEGLDISRRSSFIFISCFALTCFIISTFVCLPVYKFDPANFGYEMQSPISASCGSKRKRRSASHGARTPQHDSEDKCALEDLQMKQVDCPDEAPKKTESDSFWSFIPFLKSRHYWIAVLWFGLQLLRMLNFFGTIYPIVVRNAPSDELEKMLSVMTFILMCGMVIGPLSGLLIDTLRRNMGATPLESRRFNWLLETQVGPSRVRYSDLLAVVPSMTICSALCVAASACLLLASPATLYASFGFVMAFRSFLFGTILSFIVIAFPARVFGKLFGLCFFIAGVASLVFVPLQDYIIKSSEKAGNNGYNTLSATFLVLSLFSFVHPIQLCISFIVDSRRARRQRAADAQTTSA